MSYSYTKEILRRNLDEEESGLENRANKLRDIDQAYDDEEDNIVNNDSDLTD